jgi:hypothetical protein
VLSAALGKEPFPMSLHSTEQDDTKRAPSPTNDDREERKAEADDDPYADVPCTD